MDYNLIILGRTIYYYHTHIPGIHFYGCGPVGYRRKLQRDPSYLQLVTSDQGIMEAYARKMEKVETRSFLADIGKVDLT